MTTSRNAVRATTWVLAAVGVAWHANASKVLADEPDEGVTVPTADQAPTDEAARRLRAEADAVRESLGGSVIREFPELGGDGAQFTPWWRRFRGSLDPTTTDEPTIGWPEPGPAQEAQRRGWDMAIAPSAVVPATAIAAPVDASDAVVALRDSAAELDAAANRLERHELYEQADAMRRLAQKLRIDARRLTAGAGPAPNHPE